MLVRVKGMNDRLPSESKKWAALENKLRGIFKIFNYEEIKTPLLEYSDVFHRKSEQSDMVTKETYDFKDRSDRDLTLRPEGTAGIVRSYIENKLYVDPEAKKFFYMGPFYRYERPQKGRYREFHQFGVEVFGNNNPLIDAEVITLGYEIIKSLGLKDVSVNINSLGDQVSRTNYKNALIEHLTPYKDDLCEDCLRRLEKNPLRVLDCKVDGNKDFVLNAPKSLDFLTLESKSRFELVKIYLEAANVKFNVLKTLVRGLDYYADTVFEIESAIEGFGAGNILGGGGCYHSLVKELGGPNVTGFGFGFGMERIISALDAQGINLEKIDFLQTFVLYLGEQSTVKAVELLRKIRESGISSDIAYNAINFKSQLRQAVKSEAKFLIIVGEDEIKEKKVAIKDSKTMEQIIVDEDKLISYLKENL
ncbi:histidine--tRNA ligase [Acholeplasma sp. OttesenSCG-928-E16]|nr:histidine--tRNA ligase [Acholeplasma sp. OttesenSCG-928-E16]